MTTPQHRCPKCGHEENLDTDFLHEWSRHYDTLQWTVGGILFAAIGAAYAYIRDKFSMHIGISAVLLTLVSMFFSTGLREFRKRVHTQIPPEETVILRNPGKLKLWMINFLTHLAILFVLIRYLRLMRPDNPTWIIATFVSVSVAFYLWTVERRDPKRCQRLKLKGNVIITSKSIVAIEGTALTEVDTLRYTSADEIKLSVLGPVEINIAVKDSDQ